MMFKREVSKAVGEDYCPVVEMAKAADRTETSPVDLREAAVTETRGELFVMAANIYYRARRSPRARAAGIL